MKKQDNYVVIGGQYEPYYYGSTPTLIGAKRLANKNCEYWDNWAGWHTPLIYKIEDTVLVETQGWFTSYDGTLIRVPVEWAEPVE